MTTYLRESCPFGLLCMSFVNFYQFFCVYPSFPVGFKVGMLDLIILIPDHCISNYFKYCHNLYRSFILYLSMRLRRNNVFFVRKIFICGFAVTKFALIKI